MNSNIESQIIDISIPDKGRTSGILSIPQNPSRFGVIVAHGAANDMNSPLLEAFALGLAQVGYPVLRFNFLYAEHKRKAPDPEPVLAAAWTAAYRLLINHSGLKISRVAASGKSLGGRIASQMVSKAQLQADGLIFLGYPLHRTGDPSSVRADHLHEIAVPMLFIEGTRDTLCNLDALGVVLGRLKAPHDLFTIEGGDHSFHVPKSSGLSEAEIFTMITQRTAEWLGERMNVR